MRKFLGSMAVTAVACVVAYAPVGAAAETAPDKAALQKVTADCKAQVKKYAKYNETSWYGRRKMIKKCVAEAAAKK
jgi:hypothetical protein